MYLKLQQYLSLESIEFIPFHLYLCSVCRVVHEVKQPVTHPDTHRDLRCLTSWKSPPLYLRRHNRRLPQQAWL